MATYEENPAVFGWRLGKVEKSTEDLGKWKVEQQLKQTTTDEKLDGLAKDLEELAKAVAALRRVIITFSFTIATSAVVFAFGILTATKRI